MITDKGLLTRPDSGNDSMENVVICIGEGVDWLIKRNLRPTGFTDIFSVSCLIIFLSPLLFESRMRKLFNSDGKSDIPLTIFRFLPKLIYRHTVLLQTRSPFLKKP
jgi:hypothetical protein